MHSFDEKDVKKVGSSMNEISLQSTMNQFVRAVTTMEETVMVPSMLRDMGVSNSVPTVAKCVPSTTSENLYDFYSMLKTMKTELAKGVPDDAIPATAPKYGPHGGSRRNSRRNTLNSLNGHLPTVGVQKGSNNGNINEPKMPPQHLLEGSIEDDKAILMADDFRLHMTGLLQAFHQLTITAHYVTNQYRQGVGVNH